MVAYKRGWYIANAGVSLSFRRQIDPFQKFILQTRIKRYQANLISTELLPAGMTNGFTLNTNF